MAEVSNTLPPNDSLFTVVKEDTNEIIAPQREGSNMHYVTLFDSKEDGERYYKDFLDIPEHPLKIVPLRENNYEQDIAESLYNNPYLGVVYAQWDAERGQWLHSPIPPLMFGLRIL